MLPRVLVIGPTAPALGGVETVTRVLLASHLRFSYAVRHFDITRRGSKKDVGRFTVANVARTARQIVRLACALRSFRPDVVHIPVNSSPSALLRCHAFAWLVRWSGARVVLHMHGGLFADRYRAARRSWRRFMRATLRQSDAIVCLSPGWQRFFDGLDLGRRTAVVFNPVDPDLLRAIDAAEPDRHARTRVLFVGPLTRSKGVLELLAALRLVMDARPEVEAHLVGGELSARDAAEIRSLHAVHPHRTRIALVGPLTGEPLARAYAGTDIFVLPSHGEGVPLVVLEAMAAGCSVVATRVGGIPDVVRDGENGLLVDAGAVEALADAIVRLAADRGARERMGRANRIAAHSRYTARSFADACDLVYRALLDAPLPVCAPSAAPHLTARHRSGTIHLS